MQFECSYVGNSPELIGTKGTAGHCNGYGDEESAEYLCLWYMPIDSEDLFYVSAGELSDGNQ